MEDDIFIAYYIRSLMDLMFILNDTRKEYKDILDDCPDPDWFINNWLVKFLPETESVQRAVGTRERA